MCDDLRRNASLSVAAQERLDAFADAWKSGSPPVIEHFLDSIPDADRPPLLRELLLVDLTYRRGSGDKPTVAEYTTRFPGFSAQIEAAFAKIITAAMVERTWLRAGDEATCAWEPPSAGAPNQPSAVRSFDLQEKLGEGTFGAVWKARDRRLDRIVAVKIPRWGQLTAAEIDRFLREARAAAQLQHPNIVGIHEAGQEGETVYIVSDFIEGCSLAEWLTKHRPGQEQAAELCRKLALALDYAHGEGVIHRDLKPANVMMDRRDEPHIMDFALAKRSFGETTMTVAGNILGTPGYMSPEQARGEGHLADARSDVYSLGVMLFEMLTGERPFRGEMMAVMAQVIADEPPPVRKLNNAVARDLETICAKCLEKLPDRRYASAGELAADLGRYLRGEPTLARPVGRWVHAWRWCRRNPVVAALSSLAVVLLLGVAVVFTVAYFREARLMGLTQEAKAKADDEAQRAKKAEAQAEVDRDRARLQTEATEHALYVARIAATHRQIQDGRLDEARRTLVLCPASLRGWEWRYLDSLCYRPCRVLGRGVNGPIAYSPDGKWLAAATDNKVRFWDLQQNRIAFVLNGHAKKVTCVAFSSDGSRLASGSEDTSVRVWSIPAGTTVTTFTTHSKQINSVVFAPDGARIISAGDDNRVIAWDATTGKSSLSLTGIEKPARLAISPDGKLLAVGGVNHELCVYDAVNGRLQFREDTGGYKGQVNDLAFRADSKRLAAITEFGQLWLWEADTGKEIFSHGRIGQPGGCGVAFTPDGRRLVTAAGSVIDVWDAETGSPLSRRENWQWLCKPFRSLALSADGSVAAAASDGSDYLNRLCLWPLQIPQRARKLVGSERSYLTTAVSDDGRWIAAAGMDGVVRVWETLTETPCWAFRGHSGEVRGLAFSPDGGRLASQGKTDRLVIVWDLRSGKVIHRLPAASTGPWLCLAFSPDGNQLATQGPQGGVVVYDAHSGKAARSIPFDAPLHGLRFSPSGKQVAAANDRRLSIFDNDNGRIVHALEGDFKNLAYSGDGNSLALAEDDHVRIINTSDWSLRRRLDSGAVSALQFDGDGKRLFASTFDAKVQVWDTAYGDLLLSLADHPINALSVSVSPVSDTVVSAGSRLVWEPAVRSWGSMFEHAKAGQRVDLLPFLRPGAESSQDDKPQWPEAVRLTSAGATSLPIPVASSGSYVLRAEFMRTSRRRGMNTVGLLLPAGQGKTMLALDHHDRATSGLDQVENHGVGDPKDRNNPTNCPVRLENGKLYALEARVELQADQADVTVRLDGREIIHWHGPQKSLDMSSNWELPEPRMMGLALGDVDLVVKQLELVPLDGDTRFLEPPPGRPAAPPAAATVAAPGPIDLLSLIDLQNGAFDATVRRSPQGIEIRAEDRQHGRLVVPVWPHGSYELKCSFTAPKPWDGMGIVVPTGRERVGIRSNGLDRVKGMTFRNPANPTHVETVDLEAGQDHTLLVRVRPANEEVEIGVLLDGKPYYSWKGPHCDVGLWDDWEPPHQQTPVLTCDSKEAWICHSLELTMLDGEAWILDMRPQ